MDKKDPNVIQDLFENHEKRNFKNLMQGIKYYPIAAYFAFTSALGLSNLYSLYAAKTLIIPAIIKV